MVANKSHAFIAFILKNANVNKKDLHVSTESQTCGIDMFVHGKQVCISLPKVSRISLCYTSCDIHN